MAIDISILIPSRPFRPGALLRNLKIAKDMTEDLSNVEFLIKVDHNDKVTKEKLEQFISTSGMNIKIIILDGVVGHSGIHEYTNILAWNSIGKVLWFWSDQVEMLTRNWNFVLKKYVDQYSHEPWGFFPVSIDDPVNTCGCVFSPMITRKFLELTGRFSHHKCIDTYISWMSGRLLEQVGRGQLILTDILMKELDMTTEMSTIAPVEGESPLNPDIKNLDHQWGLLYHKHLTEKAPFGWDLTTEETHNSFCLVLKGIVENFYKRPFSPIQPMQCLVDSWKEDQKEKEKTIELCKQYNLKKYVLV